jgi:hypothetical protein
MLARLVIVGLFLSVQTVTAVAATSCDAVSGEDKICPCDVNTLRPLQGAVGMEEVKKKKDDIKAEFDEEWKDVVDDPIKVVRGPGGALFITDHHHGADAWRLADHPESVCQIVKGPTFTTEAEFWSGLRTMKLVHLEDADGKPIEPAQLPKSLAEMPDDPYRSLAWYVRKKHGFCRDPAQKEFAEFIWADFMRKQTVKLPIADVRASPKNMREIAWELARSPDAKHLLGWVGDKPKDYKCPKD